MDGKTVSAVTKADNRYLSQLVSIPQHHAALGVSVECLWVVRRGVGHDVQHVPLFTETHCYDAVFAVNGLAGFLAEPVNQYHTCILSSFGAPCCGESN